ncbi:MAG TPA: cysteine desulfurase family protein [Rhizobiaceae bacterium]|nr:cysteine desulfurase family protein [Rhizobiaceae bacterium]
MFSTPRIYFDYNASAPLNPAARAAMVEALECDGNPSSIHREGRELRKRVEHARGIIASHCGVAPKQVIFTSGASEAATLAMSPVLRRGTGEVRCSKLYVSAIEHPCVLSGGRFDNIEIMPVTRLGVIDLGVLDVRLSRHDHAKGAPFVAVMLANNETGVIQPIGEVADLVHRHGGYLLVDAVQGLGRLDIAMSAHGADFIIISAHKAGGPRGIGALILANAGLAPAPLLKGGGQENYHRAGTENVAAIAGFGAAVENLPARQAWDDIARLRDFASDGLRTISNETGIYQPVVFGEGESRLSNTLCFAVPGIRAETALISLDLAGIAVSSGSACSSGKVRKSHVLDAMAVRDDLAAGALRISLGAGNTMDEVRRFLAAWKDMAERTAKNAA